MAQNQELNKLLKEMWRLDEKLTGGKPGYITDDEIYFYNQNLSKIQEYYLKNSNYWKDKEEIWL